MSILFCCFFPPVPPCSLSFSPFFPKYHYTTLYTSSYFPYTASIVYVQPRTLVILSAVPPTAPKTWLLIPFTKVTIGYAIVATQAPSVQLSVQVRTRTTRYPVACQMVVLLLQNVILLLVMISLLSVSTTVRTDSSTPPRNKIAMLIHASKQTMLQRVAKLLAGEQMILL